MSLARVRALVVLGVLGLIAVVSVVWAIATDAQTGRRPVDPCIAASADAAIPPAKQVKMRIYNATDRDGLAIRVRKDFVGRGFTVATAENAAPGETVPGAAEVRYGAKSVGAARLLHAYVPTAEMVPDERTDDTVDLVLGTTFQALTPAAEVQKQLDALPPPPEAADEGC